MAAGGKQSNGRFGAVLLVACLVAGLIQTSMAAATSHTVGGSSGWTIPSPSSLYTTWASQQTFNVGDSLVFNFQTGSHTVAEVSKSDYDSCTATNPISTASTGPATVPISTSGNHYYICTISGHCGLGQKLAISATGTTSPAPSSSPKSSPAPTKTKTKAPSPSPASSPAPTTTKAPTISPSSSPATAPSPSGRSAAAPSPSGSSATAPSPSGSSTTAPSPSGATSPATSTVPSTTQSPAGGSTAPPPSSATVAGAGLVLPFMMVAAAFLV